jgi:hypothetical protein
MFRYGLIGNVITYGGVASIFAYLAFEMKNIGDLAVPVPEEIAKEIFDSGSEINISVD